MGISGQACVAKLVSLKLVRDLVSKEMNSIPEVVFWPPYTLAYLCMSMGTHTKSWGSQTAHRVGVSKLLEVSLLYH